MPLPWINGCNISVQFAGPSLQHCWHWLIWLDNGTYFIYGCLFWAKDIYIFNVLPIWLHWMGTDAYIVWKKPGMKSFLWFSWLLVYKLTIQVTKNVLNVYNNLFLYFTCHHSVDVYSSKGFFRCFMEKFVLCYRLCLIGYNCGFWDCCVIWV